MSTLLKEIQDAQAEDDIYWSPQQVDDLIVGTLEEIDYAVPTKHGVKLLLQIYAEKVIENGEELPPGLYGVWERTQLRRKIEHIRPRLMPGDGLAIKYCGIPQGKTVKLFAVKVEHNSVSKNIKPPEIPGRGATQKDDDDLGD
jgi:hypothetical protein